MTDRIRRFAVVHPYSFRSYTRPIRLAVLLAFGMQGTSEAAVSPAERLQMIRACEAVIIDQSFSTLADYEPAPFSSGAPGVKEYAVYNHQRNIVAIAKIVGEKWVQCTVRDSEVDKLPISERYAEWRKEFTAAFPRSKYLWLRRKLDASSTNPWAVRCNGDQLVLMAVSEWSQKHQFAVILTNEPSIYYPKKPCVMGGS